MRLKNTSGSELSFTNLGFTAPKGEFDAPLEIAEKLLTNDAIQKVETEGVEMKVVAATKSVEKKLKSNKNG